MNARVFRKVQEAGDAASVGAFALTGVLVGFADEGRTPLVTYTGQPGTAALPARATLDLHASHVGREVVMTLDRGNPQRPIVIGVLREQNPNALEARPGTVAVDVDGRRMIVSAREQLVLRCGRATLTLTKAGKILLDGTYISSRSSGVQRIKGGTIQLN